MPGYRHARQANIMQVFPRISWNRDAHVPLDLRLWDAKVGAHPGDLLKSNANQNLL